MRLASKAISLGGVGSFVKCLVHTSGYLTRVLIAQKAVNSFRSEPKALGHLFITAEPDQGSYLVKTCRQEWMTQRPSRGHSKVALGMLSPWLFSDVVDKSATTASLFDD